VLIGLGNEWRRDDGVGIAAARMVAPRVDGTVRVVELDGDPARVIEAWDGAELAVLVDAVRSGAAAGTMFRTEVGADPASLPAGATDPSSHGLGVGEAVDLARVLGRLPDRLVVHGVEAADLGEGPGLSPAVAAALPALADRVLADLTPTDLGDS
jgi:hydrogenase maturation protease